MDMKLMDSVTIRKSVNFREFAELLEFLIQVRSFVQTSQSTEFDIISAQENLRSLNLRDKNIPIPTKVMWKCFNQVGMLTKVKKYVKLLMELIIIRIEENREDFQKFAEWYDGFLELRDCIFVFYSNKEYATELTPNIKSFVDILLKKIRNINVKSYSKEVHAYYFYEFMVTEFFRCEALMNPVMEEIIKNSNEIFQCQINPDSNCLSEEIVNATECLNRYFNIVETMDKQMMRKIDSEKFEGFKLVLRKLVKMEILPKNFSIRVLKLLEIMNCE